MKYRLFLWMIAALLVVAGCTNDEIASEQPTPETEKGKITLTASVPDETPQTRLSLGQQAGTLNITVRWKAYDQIRFFFKQGDVIKEGTPVTLTPDAISDGGKTATFTIDIPAGIDGNAAYTLYAVHGSPFISLDVAGKINVQVLPAEFWTLTNLNMVPIAGQVEIAAGASIGTINFNHLGALQCLKIKNSSNTQLSFIPQLENEEGAKWYYAFSDPNAPFYDLIGNQVSYAEKGTVIGSALIHLNSGETVLCAQWVMPIPNAAVPEIKLRIVPTHGGQIVSVNSKPARANPMQTGKAYHLYALWNGTSLYFTDASLNPPPLVGNLMHADGGTDFIGVVYSKGDNKVYYNSTKDCYGWLGETLLGTGAEARVAIDGNNHPHVVFTTTDGKIAYCKHNGTAWSTEYITTNNEGACSKPDIAVDNDEKAHITYTDTEGQIGDYHNLPDIMYATNRSGTFEKNVIYNGYYSYTEKMGYYYDKGSRIAVDPSGNYYIITHQRWEIKSTSPSPSPDSNYYRVVIKTPTAGGISSSGTDDNCDIYDLEYVTWDKTIKALYMEENTNRTATIEVNGNSASFVNHYNITTTTAVPHSLSCHRLKANIAGLSGSNLFVKCSNAGTPVENIYSDITVKDGTRVAAVQIGIGSYVHVVYTDNADSRIKVMKIASW
jgi:hypothetical protein